MVLVVPHNLWSREWKGKRKELNSTQAEQKLQYKFSEQPLGRNKETTFTFFNRLIIMQVPG